MTIYIIIIIFSVISALGHYYSLASREIAEDMNGTVDTVDTKYTGSTQNAIMNPKYSKPIIGIWLATFAIILSSLFTNQSFLFLLIISILSMIFSFKMYGIVFPKHKVIIFLLNGLIKRKTNFENNNDALRADACELYIQKLKNLKKIQQSMNQIPPIGLLIYMHSIWFTVIVVTCLGYIFHAEPFSLWVLISALFAPYIAWFCGSALKATIYGPSNERVLGTAFGVIGFMLSWYWITNTGWRVSIFNFDIPGYGWVTIGFLIGFLCTTKADSDRALFDKNE